MVKSQKSYSSKVEYLDNYKPSREKRTFLTVGKTILNGGFAEIEHWPTCLTAFNESKNSLVNHVSDDLPVKKHEFYINQSKYS